MSKAFLARGWRVVFVEEDHPWLADRTDFRSTDPQLVVLRYADRRQLVALNASHQLLDQADLVLKFSGSSGAHDRFIDEWLARERWGSAHHFMLVYVDADAPMRLPFIVGHPSFYLHQVLPAFDGVWVMLGGERAAQQYQASGARATWALPVAIDADGFTPASPVPEYEADLLFIGNPTFGREEPLLHLFFDLATRYPHYRFVLAGADWDDIHLPDAVRYLGYVPSPRLAQLYSSARLVLNVTREEMAAYGDAAALRLFEAAACEACLVSDWWAGLDQLFTIEKELLIATGPDDVVRLLSTVDPAHARAIGAAARRRVLADHTANVRIAQFLSLIGLTLE